MRAKYLAGIILLAVLSGCSVSEQPINSEPKNDTRPNILFIVADDLGFTDLGSFGGEIPTPNLDSLAFQGLRLNNLHAGQACQQTRAMIMASTGHYRALEYRPNLPSGERNNRLSLDWATLPELMQDAGYATFMTGKWDLGLDTGYTPATRGFEKSFVQLGASSSFFREYFLDPNDLGFEENGVPVTFDDLPEDFYVTDHYTNKMLEYLKQADQNKPWFAYMPYTAPHWPLQLPEDWLDRHAGNYDMGYDELREQRFERALSLGVLPENSSLENFSPQTPPWSELTAEEKQKYVRAQEIYAGMIEHLDLSIGRIVDYLEETNQLENTLIVFTSDHGSSSGEHGVDTGRVIQGGGPSIPAHIDNSFENFGRAGSFIDHGRGFAEAASAPFRYVKGSLTEGGVRAVSFVYYPAEIGAGDVSSAYMSMMDFLPTFMEVANTQHPGASTFRGREVNDIHGESAWSHLTGQSAQVHSDSYVTGWSTGTGGSLIQGQYKINNTPAPGQQGLTEWHLYDLVADPGEHNNIAAQHPELVAQMVAEWEANWK